MSTTPLTEPAKTEGGNEKSKSFLNPANSFLTYSAELGALCLQTPHDGWPGSYTYTFIYPEKGENHIMLSKLLEAVETHFEPAVETLRKRILREEQQLSGAPEGATSEQEQLSGAPEGATSSSSVG